MDETLHDAASATEQPASEAVTETPGVTSEQPSESAASSEQPAFTSRVFAGKYQSADELERAYLESQREASRMAGELSALKKQTDSPTGSTDPKWKQLEGERNKWAQQLRRTDLSDSDRWQADEQVRLYDREIAYERAKHDMQRDTQQQTARQTLEQDSIKVLSAYQDDLNNQSSALFQASAQRYQQLINAGHPDDVNTRALAVAYAATITGATTSKAVQQDRSALLKTLNKTAKQAVITGAGGPATVKGGGITAKDIENMSAAEFAKYERTLQGV